MAIEFTTTGDRPLATDVQRRECIHLTGIRNADDHAELLLHPGVGGGGLHAAVFERRSVVLVEVGQKRRRFHGPGRERQRRAATHRARRRRNRCAVCGDERARHAVVGAHAREVVLHNSDAGRLACPDGGMQLPDRRLFETKGPVQCCRRHRHCGPLAVLHAITKRARPSRRRRPLTRRNGAPMPWSLHTLV